MKNKTKYCKGCGSRLVESDGPTWRFEGRCLPCRLAAGFQHHADRGSKCNLPNQGYEDVK